MDAERIDPQREQLLTVKDVCELLNCSRNTLDRLIATERLRRLKLGRAVRFHPDDVRRLIEEARR